MGQKEKPITFTLVARDGDEAAKGAGGSKCVRKPMLREIYLTIPGS